MYCGKEKKRMKKVTLFLFRKKETHFRVLSFSPSLLFPSPFFYGRAILGASLTFSHSFFPLLSLLCLSFSLNFFSLLSLSFSLSFFFSLFLFLSFLSLSYFFPFLSLSLISFSFFFFLPVLPFFLSTDIAHKKKKEK